MISSALFFAYHCKKTEKKTQQRGGTCYIGKNKRKETRRRKQNKKSRTFSPPYFLLLCFALLLNLDLPLPPLAALLASSFERFLAPELEILRAPERPPPA